MKGWLHPCVPVFRCFIDEGYTPVQVSRCLMVPYPYFFVYMWDSSLLESV